MNICVGSHVWAEDPAIAWIDGKVTKINGQEVEIQARNDKKVKKNKTSCIRICNVRCVVAVVVIMFLGNC